MAGNMYNRTGFADESSMLCAYSGHLCGREKLAGHNFCLRHILEGDRGIIASNQHISNAANPASAVAQQLFKQCTYTVSHRQGVLGSSGVPASVTGHRRCTRPAPKSDRKDGFCVEHSRRALMVRQKTGRKRSSDPIVNCLDDLSHYKTSSISPESDLQLMNGGIRAQNLGLSMSLPSTAKVARINPNESNTRNENTTVQTKEDPLNLMMRRIPYINARAFDSSELESDGDGGISGEIITVESARWRPADAATGHSADPEENSDNESLDSEMENPLKYAGAYSAEEVIRIMREKLIRLQKLYIDQFQRLRYLLKEDARKFNIRLTLERDVLEVSSIWMASRSETPKLSISREDGVKEEQALLANAATYEKIKALSHYQSPKGLEAVLQHQLMERRMKLGETGNMGNLTNTGSAGTSSNHSTGHPSSGGGSGGCASASAISGFGSLYKPTILPKCSHHLTSSTKCGDPVIPLTKFCIKHILEDTSQVLFRACNYVATNNHIKNENRNSGADAQGNGDFEGNIEKCETPIADIFEGATCVYHTQFQPPFSAFEEKSNNDVSVNEIKKEIDIEQIKTEVIDTAEPNLPDYALSSNL